MRRIVVVLGALALLLAAAGIYIVTRFEGPPEDTTAALVPADVTFYASFFVDPSSDQKRLLRDRVEEAGEGTEVGSLVEAVLDRITSAYGLAYEDVSPWIDRQMALAVLPRDGGAIIVEVADDEAARAVMGRVDGIVLGSHAVFGDSRAVRAIERVVRDDAPSLVGPDAMDYETMIEDVTDDRLAFAFAGGGNLSSRAIDLPSPLDAIEVPVGMAQGNAIALRATDAGLVFDGFSYSDGAVLLLSGRDIPLKDLGTASGDAWLAGIVPHLSVAVEALGRELNQAAKVAPGPLPRIALPKSLELTDQAFFWVGGDNLRAFSAGLDVTTGGGEGSARLARALADVPQLEARFDFRRNGIVATFGAEARGGLGSDRRFREAVGWLGGLVPIGYIDLDKAGTVPEALALVAGTQLGRTAGIQMPSWLDEVDRLVIGMDEEVAPTHWRVVISLRN